MTSRFLCGGTRREVICSVTARFTIIIVDVFHVWMIRIHRAAYLLIIAGLIIKYGALTVCEDAITRTLQLLTQKNFNINNKNNKYKYSTVHNMLQLLFVYLCKLIDVIS